MTTRAAIVAEARTWKRTPFHHQARVKHVGVDCAGVPICTGKALGCFPPDMDVVGYARTPDGTSLLAYCDQWMTRIERSEIRIGDVVVIRFDRDPQHLAIVADHPSGCLSMIHALGTPDGRGMVVEHRLDEQTLERLVQAYRMPGVED
jgi:cell wall-associated NlpC family hydrolase